MQFFYGFCNHDLAIATYAENFCFYASFLSKTDWQLL
jgi:hypothetical protein